MALMFQRLARNFAKDGYFPTDGDTIERVLSALAPPERGVVNLLDPCCGEGVALAEAQTHLGAATQSFGIEYHGERAWHAKSLLDTCIHADFMDCIVAQRGFGLLWLNPPYGDLVGDQVSAAVSKWHGRKRLEKLFYAHAQSLLQFGGALVLIVQASSFDAELAGWIARHFTRVQVYRASERQFKQVVLLGVRRRVAEAFDTGQVRERLAAIGRGEVEPEALPERWDTEPYRVPAATATPRFEATRLDAEQLAEVAGAHPCLWERFDGAFGQAGLTPRRPLRALSQWHLGLSLAAGQVSGVVRSNDGQRVYVIKGATHKDKQVSTEVETNDKGDVRETHIHTDRFVPVIRALDFTPGSPTLGQALIVR